jgi:HK97 family phage portal protein
MANPLTATWDFLRGNDLKARVAPPGPLEAKQYPDVPGGIAFWPGVPPQPGPGQYQRFLPNSPPTWVPAAGSGWGNSCNVANSAVFACLNVIATAFPEPPLRTYRRQRDGEPEALPDHPLQPLLDRPNPAHSAAELWYWTQWAKHADGNAYWRKVRAGHPVTGNVVEVWPLSPARVEPVTTAADRRAGVFISYYRYETALGQYEEIPPQNIVHFRLGLEDADHRLGCSPLKRLLREVASDDEVTRFMLNLLGNLGVLGLVVTTQDRTMSEADAERIKASITERFSGDNRGRVGVLNNGATIQQFGFSPEQLDMKTLHRVPEERIAAVMGVPAIVAGLGAGLDRNTYANARESREMFTEQKLCPLWVFDAGTIDLQLLPDFDSDPDTFTKFDLTEVRALAPDLNETYTRVNVGVQGKWISVNEARKEVGLPPVDGGDDLAHGVPTSSQPAPPGGVPALPPPRRTTSEAAAFAGQANLVGEDKAIGLPLFPALMDAMRELARPGLERDLEAYWTAQHQRVIQALIREG